MSKTNIGMSEATLELLLSRLEDTVLINELLKPGLKDGIVNAYLNGKDSYKGNPTIKLLLAEASL